MSYRYMRLLLMFDLPTLTAAERKEYRTFRKFLISEGFIMHQYSVYSKLILNDSGKDIVINRVRLHAPEKGMVTILSVTEKQFSRMIYIIGSKDKSKANSDRRIIFLGEDDDLS